ncbi:MAG: heme lyase CcmF/NrfE family subunit [Gammaproteobacteria bacterium]|nr:heme lyase CcmF/NrfE family subunit [Gammaproteobacteria bacterium]
MIPEFGNFALVMALGIALVQSIVPLVGAVQNNSRMMAVAVPAARLQFVCVAISFLCLTISFIQNDFSVLYVAKNSNSLLPLHYRISAVWGSHEGSLLLWALILSGWTIAVSIFKKSLPLTLSSRVLAILGIISVGFLLFLLLTSNPFLRLFPAAAEGNDLNPLLQDPGLIFHPPILYMGYVGLAVPFAFAIAALLQGRIDASWTRWSRPWALVAWIFLTLGIALGSWWAYYELGWGGWWFWDPVENASFMPWLVTTALLHSLAVTEQRNTFKAWTLLLSIFGFSLSLLGTFLVRSGVLVSVHAFATDPARGVFILIFLAFVIGSALFLYAWRASAIISLGRFSALSRETLLLINNVLLLVACATILVGTLYPLFMDAMQLGKISVGPPYFDKVFAPLMLLLVFVLGFGPMTHWRKDTFKNLINRLLKSALISALLGMAFVLLIFGPAPLLTTLAVVLGVWVIASSLATFKNHLGKDKPLDRLRLLPLAYFGMLVAHIGVGVFIIGVTLVSTYEQSETVRLAVGESYTLANRRFELADLTSVQGPNYNAEQATIKIFRGDHLVSTQFPEKRFYHSSSQPMTEAGIDAGLFRDFYISLGEPQQGNAWTMRLNYKPFVRWIWLGALLMAFGGLLAVLDRRYRKKQEGAN